MIHQSTHGPGPGGGAAPDQVGGRAVRAHLDLGHDPRGVELHHVGPLDLARAKEPERDLRAGLDKFDQRREAVDRLPDRIRKPEQDQVGVGERPDPGQQ